MERSRSFLFALVVAFGALALLVVLPYLQYVLLAGLLAYVLAPVHRRLAPRIGRRVAAGGLVAVVVVTVVLPTGVAVAVVVREAVALLDAVQDGRIDLSEGERLVGDVFGTDLDPMFQGGGGTTIPALLGNLVDVAGGVVDLLVGLTVLLFVLFYLLADGHRLYRWLQAVTPLPATVQDRLYANLDRLFFGVVVGNVLVAAVQGVLTGLGLLAVGFPNVLFWTVVAALLALLPLIGAFIVWAPAAAYLAVSGELVPAALLFLYGATVVSLSDNYLRPVATGRGAHVSPGILVVGFFGGVATLGFAGLFYGPIVLAFSKTLVTEYARAQAGGPAVAAD